jgi:hypothetical protein
MDLINDAPVLGNSQAASPSLVPIDPDALVHDRPWWRLAAVRLCSDWPGVLALHAAAVAAWRRRHDPDYGGAA